MMNSHMPPARRGPKPRPHTRETLIQAGVQMLHNAGYAATGIKEIVDTAEVPKGSFYNHFDSKEAFAKEVVDLYFNEGLVELRALLGNEAIPPLDRLRLYFDQRIQSLREASYIRGCLMGNLSLEIADHSPLIRDTLQAHFQTWSDLFETCIAQAQKTGAVSNRLPPPLLAQYLLNSWEGALLRMRADKSDAPLIAFVEVAFGVLLI